jgi:hypothetical protein
MHIQHLATRRVQLPTITAFILLGVEVPVGSGTEKTAESSGNTREQLLQIRMTRLNRENSRTGILSQAVGEDTTSSARADDDIVVLANIFEILSEDFTNFRSGRC